MLAAFSTRGGRGVLPTGVTTRDAVEKDLSSMTNTHKAALGLTGAYGLIALVGGIIGFVKAGSVASLIAGGGSGIILIASAIIARQRPRGGLITALVVSLILIGRFIKSSIDHQGVAPVAAVMILGGVAVVVSAALALKEPRASGV